MAEIVSIEKYIKSLRETKKVINSLIDKINQKGNSSYSKYLPTLTKTLSLLESEITYFETAGNEQNNGTFINIQYKTYIEKRIGELIRKCRDACAYTPRKLEELEIDFIERLLESLGDASELLIFDQFKYGNSNYVLFGKNGSGKTTLLNKLAARVFFTNAVVIKATRNIDYRKDALVHPHNINLKGVIECKDDGAMTILSKLILEKEIEQRRTGIDESLIVTTRAQEIYNSLGLDRLLSIKSNGSLELSSNNSRPYSLSKGSDGEKSAAFIIMMILLAPNNSFVFIDEPENHLNGALMKKLFDKLEDARKDLIFVYATHNTSFIETRNNAQLVYLRKESDISSSSFVRYNDVKELPLDVVLSVEGTNDNVVFCEGEYNNSLDSKFLKYIFPNYQIIPSQGCTKVIIQTEVFNKYSALLRKKAFGVIDYDFKDQEEVEDLKKRGIFSLDVNEIENIFFSEECLEEIRSFLSLTKSLEAIKNDILQIVKNKEKAIMKDYANKLMRELHFKNKVPYEGDLGKEIDKLNSENKEKFLNHFMSFQKEFDVALKNNDFSYVLKMVPGKIIINDVAKLLGFLDSDAFTRQLLIRLESNKLLSSTLQKYVPGFPF